MATTKKFLEANEPISLDIDTRCVEHKSPDTEFKDSITFVKAQESPEIDAKVSIIEEANNDELSDTKAESVNMEGTGIVDEGSLINDSENIYNLLDDLLQSVERENARKIYGRFPKEVRDELIPDVFKLKPEIEQLLLALEYQLDLLQKHAEELREKIVSLLVPHTDHQEVLSPHRSESVSRHALVSDNVTCQLCNKEGHNTKDFWNKDDNSADDPSCSAKGKEKKDTDNQTHTKSRPLSRKQANIFPHVETNKQISKVLQPTICQICNKRGHTADRCFKIFPPKKTGNAPAKCQSYRSIGDSANWYPRLHPINSTRAQVSQKFRHLNPGESQYVICNKGIFGGHTCSYRKIHTQTSKGKSFQNDRHLTNLKASLNDLASSPHYCEEHAQFIRKSSNEPDNEEGRFGKPGNDSGLPSTGATGGTSRNEHPIRVVSVLSPNHYPQ